MVQEGGKRRGGCGKEKRKKLTWVVKRERRGENGTAHGNEVVWAKKL